MLETQTQIIGAGLPLTSMEACAAIDSIEPIGGNAVMMVCLCDQEPSDLILSDRQFGNWRLCKTHNAVKLESMSGMNVMLYAINEHDSIEPIRCQPERDFTAIAKEIVSQEGYVEAVVSQVEAILRREFA
jgi:hypothetical protein